MLPLHPWCVCMCDVFTQYICCLGYWGCSQLSMKTMSQTVDVKLICSGVDGSVNCSCFSVGLQSKKIIIKESVNCLEWVRPPCYDDNRFIHSRMNFLSLRKSESESTHNHQHSTRFLSASRKTAINVCVWVTVHICVSHVWMYVENIIFCA